MTGRLYTAQVSRLLALVREATAAARESGAAASGDSATWEAAHAAAGAAFSEVVTAIVALADPLLPDDDPCGGAS